VEVVYWGWVVLSLLSVVVVEVIPVEGDQGRWHRIPVSLVYSLFW
jgi:hypothetical protein